MTRKIKAWGLKKCSTTSKALAYLKARNIAVAFTDYSVIKPDVTQIEAWIEAVGGWEKLLNRSGLTWRKLGPEQKANLDKASAARLAWAYPSLIRRPLIEYEDGSISLGFAPKVQARF